MTNVPTAPKPHVVEVPQPDQPGTAPAATASAPGAPLDPAKVAEYQKRFQDGYVLQQAGKLVEARGIYDGILAEQPDAKRSLLEAGRVSFQLGELPRANGYLEKLHTLVPDFPAATEMLIQINQAMKHDVKVELLAKELRDLYASGKVPEMPPYFVRERINLDQQAIIITQFYDFTKEPDTVYMAEVFDKGGQPLKRILLNYDVDATKALRSQDAKYQNAEIFTWYGHEFKDGKVSQIDAYQQIFALPDYAKFRSGMFSILTNPPKPIVSAPVDGNGQPVEQK